MRNRPAARLLVVDAQGRLLLFRFAFAKGPLAGASFWATPGGEVDPGESFADGARRELREETGLVIDDPGPQVARRQFELVLPDGETVWADERYFRIRVGEVILTRDGWTELEREILAEHRWWTPGEIRAADEQIWPEDAADLIAGETVED